jgi:hypothetical protein
MKRWLTALCFLALAACGQVPLPFSTAPHVIADSPFLDTPTAVGIAILPISGMAPALSAQIGRAMADKFEVYEIPAEPVAENRGLGFSLQGEVESSVAAGDEITARIIWRLKSRRGAIAADYVQRATMQLDAWQNGDRGAAVLVAGEAASKLTLIIAGDAPTQTAPVPPPPRPKLATVSIKPVEGAPGDGRESLQLAVTQMLLENGVRRDELSPEVTLACTVTTAPFNDTLQRVSIVWRALARDGSELGNVKLENTIPVGSLDGSWGPTAFVIANAAGNDLLQLLATVAGGVANPPQPRQ